ncbi:hypothetical protein BGZ63DRAFT_406836 [Mariannaea sp. PMI_226]|nr:hypothetical protein BGZ63DRAFT_406836 [Mariannaea sp. PMI_226]
MHFSTVLATFLATAITAAPTEPRVNTKDTRSAVNSLGSLSDYFNLLAVKAQAAKHGQQPTVCDLSKAKMPVAPTPLPEPAKGLTLHHVAVGRGTQNYTCATSDSSSVPTAAGALATLYNASCAAALYPDLLELVPGMAVHLNIPMSSGLSPAWMAESGHHYFTNATTPFFNLQTQNENLGQAPCQKNSSSPAPPNAPVGQNGESAVPWLQLPAIEGATDGIKEVYRVSTAGGSAPATCQGQEKSFQVEYAALYWFYAEESQ